jgi:hypothetical protein
MEHLSVVHFWLSDSSISLTNICVNIFQFKKIYISLFLSLYMYKIAFCFWDLSKKLPKALIYISRN